MAQYPSDQNMASLPQDDEILSDLLLYWEEEYEKGNNISAGQLCEKHPHLLGKVEKGIKALKASVWNQNLDNAQPTHGKFYQYLQMQTVLKDRFRIEAILGQGGQGIVYKARDLKLERDVAIKSSKKLSNLLDLEKMSLLEEAKRVASLKHPGIVTVFDILDFQDTFLLVTEFVEGGDLGTALASNSLSLKQKLKILEDVANALDYAHDKGVIHYDLKPSNILLDSNLRAKVCDFGISLGSQKPSGYEHLGSLAYASPEQIRGGPLNSSTDIWSLGVVAFQATTGKMPFGNHNETDLISRILDYPAPSASKENNHLPGYIDRNIKLCLEKNPEKRPSNARSLFDETSGALRIINNFRDNKSWSFTIFSKVTFPAISFAFFLLLMAVVFSTIQANLNRQADLQIVLTPERTSKALNNIENWHTGIKHGWTQTKDGAIRGEVSNHLVFNHLLTPPFKIEFEWKIVLGQRPRMMFYKSNTQLKDREFITLGNEGFSKRIGMHGPYATPSTQNRPKYSLNQNLNCVLILREGNYEFIVDNQLVADGNYPMGFMDSFKLAISAGDPSSPGISEFKNFRFTSLSNQ
jgi:serine/threonine-protein kinase